MLPIGGGKEALSRDLALLRSLCLLLLLWDPRKFLRQTRSLLKSRPLFSSTLSVALALATEQTNCEDFQRDVQRAFVQVDLRLHRHRIGQIHHQTFSGWRNFRQDRGKCPRRG